ncbi:glycosyl hydrolase family 3 N-terminal domain protein [Marvinbryantia formatexigens DSM 14469]|uniref:Glycosyl hydrolase family 3 N-terminal domain protein n=1 Tax=Marvinbryantia formatexigens DSM 14469 TaxID=478749 RepID=C6L9K4_9FIRM|nr:glycoside hydrolase family 3 N-terminal domain-containing protein [Marvinbryantia formatexigens]EET62943.1 glycosyl hydrolase family 3 N-terminal domain protein [Marvinbryantia formatexigens DSM 14469]UWO23526.1 glycoside hydrolase family 3 C-terminal domain-containing protein [Marvinbryantia formatexigens DSM 14469]SDG55285.1 beta-glucosidase [Marvinbryantia formatexigens]
MSEKKTKKAGRPIARTAVGCVLMAGTLAAMAVANAMIPPNMNAINGFFGDAGTTEIKLPKTYNEGLNLNYNEADYTADEMKTLEQALNEEIVEEGTVLLKNDGNLMPFAAGTSFSFFGKSSVKLMGNNWYDLMAQMGIPADPGLRLDSAFTEEGFQVNETLWKFYDSGNGSGYGLGSGSLNYGDGEDFSINECPLEVLESEAGLLESAEGTVPVFVWSRKVGEGRDMPRSMYNHADNPEDQAKSYLEPDSTELEILQYLNDNFDEVVLLVNASAAMELGWTEQFPSIKSIVYIPSVGNYGLNGLADVFSGAANPSGKTVDTFAADASSAPAAQNYGDYQYVDENGEMTKYNYVNYQEGIYVGYRYYETRYEDVVLEQGNAGDYDYASEVIYPLGYGLSYTSFEQSNFRTSWEGDICTVTVDVKNTGDTVGKDVVQVYAQAPYTDYDKENNVEKSSVVLVGFGKTGELAPGASETVAVTFDKEQLASYDYKGAKTYILDEGDYYIAAGTDAHDALNNILAAKGMTAADGMTAAGNADMTAIWSNDALDTTTYAVNEKTGVEVTNLFDFADSGCTYLSRSDWQGTWPEHDGEVSTQVSTWGNEINGDDGVSYTYTKAISAEELAKLDSFDSLNPEDADALTDTPVYGADNDLRLIDMRGLDYEDSAWDALLDELNPEDYQTLITASGYGTAAIDSVGKPFALDQDAATGLTGGGTGVNYCGTLVLAQTWNQELAEYYGEIIGNQALIGGCVGWYAPAMNIHRLPYSGRNNEYYSEDGFLSGVIAAATSRGAASKGMYTFIKHFALNDQENHRGDREGNFGVCTWSNEQAIREIYLKPFQMCVQNDAITLNYLEEDGNGGYQNTSREYPPVTAVMTAFNRLGYTWTGGCYPLITELLRSEWGFDGFVITDNANTGSPTYMNAEQMIEAGGDGALTTTEYAVWEFDKDSAADYHYGREAVHHILYTVANSKLMNGLMPGARFVTPLTVAEKIVIAVNAVGVVLLLLLAWFIFRGFRRWRRNQVRVE